MRECAAVLCVRWATYCDGVGATRTGWLAAGAREKRVGGVGGDWCGEFAVCGGFDEDGVRYVDEMVALRRCFWGGEYLLR